MYTYDPEANASYIRLDNWKYRGTPVTRELDPIVNVDFGPDGQVLGIEILWPGVRIGDEN